MEWMLQVVDEFDDIFGVLRHACLGLMAEIGKPMLVAVSLGAAVAGPRLGADPALIATADEIDRITNATDKALTNIFGSKR